MKKGKRNSMKKETKKEFNIGLQNQSLILLCELIKWNDQSSNRDISRFFTLFYNCTLLPFEYKVNKNSIGIIFIDVKFNNYLIRLNFMNRSISRYILSDEYKSKTKEHLSKNCIE